MKFLRRIYNTARISGARTKMQYTKVHFAKATETQIDEGLSSRFLWKTFPRGKSFSNLTLALARRTSTGSERVEPTHRRA